jgi:hypothetical protein
LSENQRQKLIFSTCRKKAGKIVGTMSIHRTTIRRTPFRRKQRRFIERRFIERRFIERDALRLQALRAAPLAPSCRAAYTYLTGLRRALLVTPDLT